MSFLLKLAKLFCFVGGAIIFILGIVGLVSCWVHLDDTTLSNKEKALCIGATVVAIVVGLIITGTEASRSRYAGGFLNNTAARGILYILLVIVPFWGWFSWIGSCLVIIGAIIYLVAFCTGRHYVYEDLVKAVVVAPHTYTQPTNTYQPNTNNVVVQTPQQPYMQPQQPGVIVQGQQTQPQPYPATHIV
jgi:hypothetical protein